MRSILLFPFVARCLETIDACIWRMFVFMYVVVAVSGNVCCVTAVVKYSIFLPWSVEVCCMFVFCVHPVAVLNAASA